MAAVDVNPAASVRIWAYQTDHAVWRETVELDEVSDLLANPSTLVWIDLIAPSPAILKRIQAECQIHPLAVEDLHSRHQRPKIDEYDRFYLIVFYVPHQTAPTERLLVATEEVGIAFGERFLVTVHQRPLVQIEQSIHHWRQQSTGIGLNMSALLYVLLDGLVDAYFPIVDQLGETVDELHEQIFAQPNRQALERLATLRRDLLQIRRVLAPEREVINILLRRDQPILPAATIVYFYDIYDHIVRLTETVDTQRDLLGTAVDAYLSLTSNNLNEVMKTLTGWSIILMTATLIAGIYGMNFQQMPELAWPFGYPLALGLMLLAAGLLFRYFRQRNWL